MAHPGDALAQRAGRPYRGPRRVVELVRETGRQRAERDQLVALSGLLLGVAQAEVEAVKQVRGHRELVVHECAEVIGVHDEEARRPGGAQRVHVLLRVGQLPVGLLRVGLLRVGRGDERAHGAGVDATLCCGGEQDVVVAAAAELLQLAVEEDVEAGCGRALAEDLRWPVEGFHVAAGGDPVELIVGERLEQEQRAQFVWGQAFAHSSLQIPVHQRHGHRALPHRRSDPLHRLMTDVAGDEDPGQARLEVVRVAVEIPAGWPLPVGQKVGSGEHEPARVAPHHAVEPAGERCRADEDEQPGRLDLGCLTASDVAQPQRFEVVDAVAGHDLGAGAHGDVRECVRSGR